MQQVAVRGEGLEYLEGKGLHWVSTHADQGVFHRFMDGPLNTVCTFGRLGEAHIEGRRICCAGGRDQVRIRSNVKPEHTSMKPRGMPTTMSDTVSS